MRIFFSNVAVGLAIGGMGQLTGYLRGYAVSASWISYFAIGMPIANGEFGGLLEETVSTYTLKIASYGASVTLLIMLVLLLLVFLVRVKRIPESRQ